MFWISAMVFELLMMIINNISFSDESSPTSLTKECTSRSNRMAWRIKWMGNEMDWTATGAFVAAATALLGSPGPGIAALLAVGRAEGWGSGLRYFSGLQLGLALACAVTGAGLVSVLAVFPFALRTLTLSAGAYLIYLAYRIATAAVGTQIRDARVRSSALAGFLLAIANPKAYLAFVSLMASRALVQGSHQSDVSLKWLLCVMVIVVVDLAWLFVGVQMRRLRLGMRAERVLNVCLGATVLLAAVFMGLPWLT
jgi:threonine/homoserine/homoserine lactone efflux protein